MLFPLALLLLYKLCGNKINVKTCAIFIGGAAFVPFFLSYMVDTMGISSLDTVRTTLNSYITRNEEFTKFYNGVGFAIDALKTLVVILACIFTRKNKENKSIRDFLILFTIATFVLMTSSIALVRFTALIFYIGIIPLMDAVLKKTKELKYLLILVWVTAILAGSYNIYKIYPHGYNGLVRKKIFSDYSLLLEKEV